MKHTIKHFLYSGGWKKFEPLWNLVIKTKNLAFMLPLLESILSRVRYDKTGQHKETESTLHLPDEQSDHAPDPLPRLLLSNPTEHNL